MVIDDATMNALLDHEAKRHSREFKSRWFSSECHFTIAYIHAQALSLGLVARAASPQRCYHASWLRTILGLNMRYLDTGGRNPQECLGDWLTKTLQDQGITEIRLQTGYFSLDGASLLVPVRHKELLAKLAGSYA